MEKTLQDFDGSDRHIYLEGRPDKCPFCQNKIEAQYRQGYFISNENSINKKQAHVIYQCPGNTCERIFIAIYEIDNDGHFYFKRIFPKIFIPITFPESVQKMSSAFDQIYNQAAEADAGNLEEIAGPGYRKSLEFLIKDFLIHLEPESREDIKSKFLGTLIREKITDQNIKTCAERATWLGNDETHYFRKWEKHDLDDLKRLIRLTVIWVESHLLTAEYEASMPKPEN